MVKVHEGYLWGGVVIKFLKLTEANEVRRTLLINVDNIAYMQTSNKANGHVYIKLMVKSADMNKNDGQYFFVEEPIEDILLQLNTDNTLAPVIMTADEALKYYKVKDGCN